ncbi:glycosyl transferase family 90-domain-containing protein [Mycena rebaudengoi]|nr:glycosyl transferase family 90-domain-containing protein [Mycena rebaudengoi]
MSLMSPAPLTALLRRRSLRRPALAVVALLTLVFLMSDFVFDSRHSTRIAFKLASSRIRSPSTRTVTKWATRTVSVPQSTAVADSSVKMPASRSTEGKRREVATGKHTYRPDGLVDVNPDGPHPIFELVERAEAAWAAKQARASTSLREAVAEYRRRYKRAPPRGFDEWWYYVEEHAVQLPDEYDQIDRDLAMFWGMDPRDLRVIQRDWEAHADSYTIGKDADEEGINLLNFTLPGDEETRFNLATGAFQTIELLTEVERHIPPFRAVFSPHDNPNLPTDYELQTMALEAAAAGKYIDINHPPPVKHGWISACPPFSPAWLDPIPFSSEDGPPITYPPPLPPQPLRRSDPMTPDPTKNIYDTAARTLPPKPRSFIHDHLRAMDPCLHPTHLTAHGEYLAQRAGPTPHRTLIPQFSYSSTLLHHDIRPAMPLNWVPDDAAKGGPVVLPWAEKSEEKLQWRGSNTGIWHNADGRWRDAHRTRLMALASGEGSRNISVLRAPEGNDERVGEGEDVGRRAWVGALMDVAFTGRAVNCDEEKGQCRAVEEMFEFRRGHEAAEAARYKYIIDVDGNGWSSRFQRLITSGSLIFKATTYPEWFQDRIQPWVHYVPVQNDYSDVLDALIFFRGDPAGARAHDAMAQRIAEAGRAWSLSYWRKEDLTAYMFRLFLEYARVMSPEREKMSFVM